MDEPRITPGAFRRRLALAFVLTLGLLTAALHTVGYIVIRGSLVQDAFERALPQAEFVSDLAAERLATNPGDDDIEGLIEWLEGRRLFAAVLVVDGEEHRSSPDVGLPDVPEELLVAPDQGDSEDELPHARTAADETNFLVFRSELSEDVDMFLFYAQRRVWENVTEVRRVLTVSWFIVVVVAGLIASLFARRVLHPVARAGAAARSLAEGLLDTRLPVETSDEFGAWAQSFNRMADALQAKIVALRDARDRERRFTADVSHELKTPLTALTGAASILASHIDELPPDARRPAELLVSDVRRLTELVEDLMEVSRLDAGQESVGTEEFDPTAQARSLVEARGWSSKVAVLGENGRVVSDPRRYERIVSNLIENAIEHGGEPVEVELTTTGEHLTMLVRDRGPGIPPEHLPRIFDRFYKADPARSTSGSGLGLAIARENARLMGGDIEVTSGADGSAFRVTLRSAPGGSNGGAAEA